MTSQDKIKASQLRRLRESLARVEQWSAEAEADAPAIRAELVHMTQVAEALRDLWN